MKSKLRALFLDTPGGNYLPQALKLAGSFEKMYYHIVEVSPFPTPHSDSIGTGYDEIEVLISIWDRLDLFDLVIIPDIYLGGYASAMKKLGKLTFGGTLDTLETQRDQFYDVQERLGMDVAPFTKVIGFKNLRKFIKQKQNNGSYAKINWYRGAFETFKYVNSNHSEPLLDKIESDLGPLGQDMVFVVQKPVAVDNGIEVGMDSYVVNGQVPNHFLFGVEAKDSAYLGKFETRTSAPKAISEVNDLFKPALDVYQATNFYSTEIRCDLNTGNNYYNDICGRMAQPASNVYLEMYTNIGDVIENAAKGILIEPKARYKYGVELLLKSNWVGEDFLTVTFPEEFKDNVKLKGSFIRDGQYYVSPFIKSAGYNLDIFGSVVVTGDDLTQIMEKALEIAKQVQGYDIYYNESVLNNIMDEINNLSEKIGYKF